MDELDEEVEEDDLEEDDLDELDDLEDMEDPDELDDLDEGEYEDEIVDPAIAWQSLLSEHDIVVGCGSGGVGKTTISAALALQGARMGRRSCVVTIDPARRLADSLGLESLGNKAHRVEGAWPGELWALQLDPKSTFDDLVRKHADTPEQAEGIFQNRIYRNLTEALSGTQEYMAMEKLYELAEEDRFDLIVVDTPPSRNALDFLEAPSRLTRFLGHRLFQFLLFPTRASLRAFTMASQALLKTISRVAGAEIVNDAVAFFQAFAGMEEGFRLRAVRVKEASCGPLHGIRARGCAACGHGGGSGLVRGPARRRRTAGRCPGRQPSPPGVLAERGDTACGRARRPAARRRVRRSRREPARALRPERRRRGHHRRARPTGRSGTRRQGSAPRCRRARPRRPREGGGRPVR